ncbi:hypothetical protein BHM03_00056777 [Ensete ventricosum]|nr:hypothetical protein BHM03_00056777 [Ensete ventricosum]
MSGLPVDLGGSATRTPGYKRFNHTRPAGKPSKVPKLGAGNSTAQSGHLVFFRRSPGVFPVSFPIPSVNLLANFDKIPLYHLNPGPMPKLDLGPLSGFNFIAPIIVSSTRC